MIFIYHYKERNPNETIEIIQNFFKNRNLEIYELNFQDSTIGTYSCNYGLFLNSKKILSTNGKGITPELAKASGLAELYERFCFFNYYIYNYSKVYEDIIIKQKNTKKISLDQLLSDIHIKTYLKKILPEVNEEYLNILYNNKIYGTKFYNLNNSQDIQYKSIQMLGVIVGTNGVAAGNTLEEALVQGISELYEREILDAFYHNKIKEFYQLNIKFLDQKYQNYIKILKEKYIEVKIYDCSYFLHTPVVMVVFFDKKNNYFFYNFGAHPIFNIALERCFTEIFQGNKTISQIKNYQNLTQYRDSICTDLTIKSMASPHHYYGYINENLIFNITYIDTYNQNVFIDNNQDLNNKILLEYIQQLNKSNNKQYFYADISLTKDMYTIFIIQNYLTQTVFIDHILNIHNYDIQVQKNIYKIIQSFFYFYDFLIKYKQKEINIKQFINNFINAVELLDINNNFDSNINLLIDYWTSFWRISDDGFLLTNKEQPKDVFYLFLDIFCNKNDIIEYPIQERRLYNVYKLIESYYIQKYPKEKIRKILNWLHYEDIELNFELKDMTPLWYINKIFIEPLYNKYHSQEYYDFINIFGADDNIINE